MKADANKGSLAHGCRDTLAIAVIRRTDAASDRERTGIPMLKHLLLLSCSCVLIDAGPVTSVVAQSVPPELVGAWLVEDIAGGGVIDDLQTTLELNEDGTYAGFAGCNSYTGTFDLTRGDIIFSPAGNTRRVCAPAVMDQETKFLNVLRAELSWTIKETKLMLAKPGSKATLRLVSHRT